MSELVTMSRDEARLATDAIKAHMSGAAALIYDVYLRQGWAALGYSNFAAWGEAEFGKSASYVYRLKDLGGVQAALSAFSPMGENIEVTERQIRDMGIKQLPPAQQAAAAQVATAIASARGDTKVSAEHLRSAVVVVKGGTTTLDPTRQQVYASKCSPIIAALDKGELTPGAALAWWHALQACAPKVRGDLLRLNIRDRAVIAELNRLAGRKSETYDEIVASKHLQFVSGGAIPAAQATAADLRRLLDEKYNLHRTTPSVKGELVTVDLWRGEPGRSFAALRKSLHDDDMQALKDLFATWSPALPEKEGV